MFLSLCSTGSSIYVRRQDCLYSGWIPGLDQYVSDVCELQRPVALFHKPDTASYFCRLFSSLCLPPHRIISTCLSAVDTNNIYSPSRALRSNVLVFPWPKLLPNHFLWSLSLRRNYSASIVRGELAEWKGFGFYVRGREVQRLMDAGWMNVTNSRLFCCVNYVCKSEKKASQQTALIHPWVSPYSGENQTFIH